MKYTQRKGLAISFLRRIVGVLLTLMAFHVLYFTPALAQQPKTKKWEEDKSTKRIALVMGNGEYQNGPKLKNPINDATKMSEMLERLGFEVIPVKNGTRKQMMAGIDAFGGKLTSNCVALVYYSGHGIEVDGVNYLLPVDFRGESKADVEDEAVATRRILGRFVERESRVNIVILDACRKNPFKAWSRDTAGGIGKDNAPKGTLIAYATAPGSVASDNSEGANGLYTQELLKQLPVPEISVQQMFTQVLANVAEASGERQLPYMESSLRGDLYLAKNIVTGSGDGGNGDRPTDGQDLDLKAYLKVTTTPENATVTVNGEKIKNGTFSMSSLGADGQTIQEKIKVRVLVTADKYDPKFKEVELERGSVALLTVKLVSKGFPPPPPPPPHDDTISLKHISRQGETWEEQIVTSLRSKNNGDLTMTLTYAKKISVASDSSICCESALIKQAISSSQWQIPFVRFTDTATINLSGLLTEYSCTSNGQGGAPTRARLYQIANPVFSDKSVKINERWSIDFVANSAGVPAGKAEYRITKVAPELVTIAFSYSDDSGVSCNGECEVEKSTGRLYRSLVNNIRGLTTGQGDNEKTFLSLQIIRTK